MYQLVNDVSCNKISSFYYQDRYRYVEYQSHFYRALKELIISDHLTSVLDLGCGHWIKLYKYIYPVTQDVTGVDLPESIDRNGVAPFGNFIGCDLDTDVLCLNRKFDVIVASDIIEHLKNPDKLFLAIKEHLCVGGSILISTPDRRNMLHMADGRPQNKSHVREWTEAEFCDYLKASGFVVLDIYRSMKQSNIYFCKMKGS